MDFNGVWLLRNGETVSIEANEKEDNLLFPWVTNDGTKKFNSIGNNEDPEFDIRERLSNRAGKMK